MKTLELLYVDTNILQYIQRMIHKYPEFEGTLKRIEVLKGKELYITPFLEILHYFPNLKHIDYEIIYGDDCDNFQNFVNVFANNTTWKTMKIPNEILFKEKSKKYDCDIFDNFQVNSEDNNSWDIEMTSLFQLTKSVK